MVSGVILVGTSCDLGGALGGGHLCQVELQVRGGVETRVKKGNVSCAVSSCGGAGLQQLPPAVSTAAQPSNS